MVFVFINQKYDVVDVSSCVSEADAAAHCAIVGATEYRKLTEQYEFIIDQDNTNRRWLYISEYRLKTLPIEYLQSIYNQYYLENIKSIMNCSGKVSYQFLSAFDILDAKVVREVSTEALFNNYTREILPNLYLKFKPNELADSIVRRGMDFPFVCIRNDESQVEMYCGNHRVRCLRDAGVTKKYLSIVLEPNWVSDKIVPPSIYNMYPEGFWENADHPTHRPFTREDEHVVCFRPDSLPLTIAYFAEFGTALGSLVYNCGNNLEPLKIINDEVAFYEWKVANSK